MLAMVDYTSVYSTWKLTLAKSRDASAVRKSFDDQSFGFGTSKAAVDLHGVKWLNQLEVILPWKVPCNRRAAMMFIKRRFPDLAPASVAVSFEHVVERSTGVSGGWRELGGA